MERSVDVATGESVTFSYELAGLGSRFLAVFIDIALQSAVFLGGALLLGLLAAWDPRYSATRAVADVPTKLGEAVLLGAAVFAAFVIFFGYFIVFEWAWRGRTPGKKVLGIRVVRDGGFPLDFTSSVVRNAIRILEFGVGFYAFSAVAMLLSPFNRRFGDMAAGSIVIRDARFESGVAYDVRRATDADVGTQVRRDDSLVHDLGDEERELVRRYAARRTGLGARARVAIAADIAAVVRPKLAANFAHLDDDDLLVHLAATSLAADA